MQKIQRALPRELRSSRIVFDRDRHIYGGLVGERMHHVVFVELVRNVRLFELYIEQIDILNVKEGVLRGEMSLDRRFDLRSVDEFKRWHAVKANNGVQFRNLGRREQ